MVNFSNPIWLWALLALFVPLLIHIINKGKPKAIPIGSLLWLPQKNTQQSQRLKFQDFWLWLIRSLLFVLVAGLMAQPFLNQSIQQKNKHWLLLKEDIPQKIIQQIEDTIPLNQWAIKKLSYGLEIFDFKANNSSVKKSINPYAILQFIENEKHKPLSTTIIGDFKAADLKGETPNVSFPVDWIFLPKEHSNKYIAKIEREKISSYLSTKETKHLTNIIESKTVAEIDSNIVSLNLKNKTSLIVYDENFKNLQKATSAALKALQQYHNISYQNKIKQTEDLTTDFKNADLLFWLSESDPPSLDSITTIYKTTKKLPNGTFIKLSQNEIEWKEPIHHSKLPYLLNDMIFYKEAINKKITQTDNRPIHASFYKDEYVEHAMSIQYQKNTQKSLTHYAWFLLMMLLVAERYLNNR